jgi:hypothetical protein
VTEASPVMVCAICGGAGTVAIDPPRRTFARGADPTDASYSIIALLPDIPLCDEHSEEVQGRKVSVGWCDDLRCRMFGESGAVSACGQPYKELRR